MCVSHPAPALRGARAKGGEVTSERGDIITGYLVRLVAGLALVGLVVIEGAAVTFNQISLEETIDRAARAGASAYAEDRSREAVEHAVVERLEHAGAQLVHLDVGSESVTVTGTRPAKVLISDRIEALSTLVTAEHTGRADADR